MRGEGGRKEEKRGRKEKRGGRGESYRRGGVRSNIIVMLILFLSNYSPSINNKCSVPPAVPLGKCMVPYSSYTKDIDVGLSFHNGPTGHFSKLIIIL